MTLRQREHASEQPGHKFRLRTERCETCLYRLHYDKVTRDRVLGDVKEADGYVQCYSHDLGAHVCCRGYWDAVEDRGGTPVQIAWRLHAAGFDVIEHVSPEMYPRDYDAEEEDDDFER